MLHWPSGVSVDTLFYIDMSNAKCAQIHMTYFFYFIRKQFQTCLSKNGLRELKSYVPLCNRK